MRRFTIATLAFCFSVSSYAQEAVAPMTEATLAPAQSESVSEEHNSESMIERDPAARPPRGARRNRGKAKRIQSRGDREDDISAEAEAATPEINTANSGSFRGVSHPLQSTFFFPEKGQLVIEPKISYGFSNSESERTNSIAPGVSQISKSEDESFGGEVEAQYGLTRNLTLALGLNYKTSTSSDAGTTYSNGTSGLAIRDADVRDSGLSDPQIGALYRFSGFAQDDWILEAGALFVLGVQDAKRGTNYDLNNDSIDESATSGNSASGGHSAVLAARLGTMLSPAFGFAGQLTVGQSFSSEYTVIRGNDDTTDQVVNQDSYTTFRAGAEVEWRPTDAFSVNPSVSFSYVPEINAQYAAAFQTVRVSSKSGSAIGFGINAGYSVTTQFALLAAYDLSMASPGDATASINNIVQPSEIKPKDNTSHSIRAGVRFVF